VFKCTFNKKLAEHPVKVAWIAQDTKGVAPENYGMLGVSSIVENLIPPRHTACGCLPTCPLH